MERRSSERVPTELGVSCRVPARPERAVLVDLSRAGCRLAFDRQNINLGATVSLDLRAGRPVSGQVIWAEGPHAGVRFHSVLPGPVALEFGLERREALPEQERDPAPDGGSGGSAQHPMRCHTGPWVA